MTRSYFLDYVTDWYELIDLCRDYDCDICEDIIDDDQLDDYVLEDINNSERSWRDIRDFLSDIPTGYEYYRCDGTFDYVGLDESDFEDYKSRVLDWMDEDSLGSAATAKWCLRWCATPPISSPSLPAPSLNPKSLRLRRKTFLYPS